MLLYLKEKKRQTPCIVFYRIFMQRPIALSLSPNTEKSDVLAALKLLFAPWEHFNFLHIRKVEAWFEQYFNCQYAVSFNSGRSALIAALKSIGISQGDEILLQAFTCGVVPLAILQTGATPVYVDTDSGLTMDIKDTEKKITKNTKAILFQYTFGIPANIEAVKALAKKQKLFLIEDCAHTLGDSFHNQKIGTFGDMSFFSFGRDKAFSSVFGGVAITNNKTIGEKMRVFQMQLPKPSYFFVIQQLLHPILFSIILPFYDVLSIGKILLVFFQKLHLLSFPVSEREKKAEKNAIRARKFSNVLARLALEQIGKIDRFNKNRQEITAYYLKSLKNTAFQLPFQENRPLLRFPVLVENREQLMAQCKKQHIYLGDWYSRVIDPKGTKREALLYKKGSCPNAEKHALKIINLPTYPTMEQKDAAKVVQALLS